MIDIIVQRGEGERQGDDIVDPLISSIPVALQRGRNELDRQSSSPQTVEVEAVYRSGLRVGQLAKFYDSYTGLEWAGKIVGISHSVRGPVIATVLQVEKPTVF